MKKIFLSRQLPDATMQKLQGAFDLSWNQLNRPLKIEELIRACQGQEGLISLLSDKLSSDFFDQCDDLKIVANYAVGFNNIDLEAATKKGIVVTNTPGVLTETSADTAFALLLAVARRIVEADKFVRTGNWQGWYPTEYLGKDVWGGKLGIVGLGRIGKAVAERATGFRMKIKYWNRTRLSTNEEKELGLEYLSFDELLKWADFISLHVAYNEETHHLIGAEQLEQMSNSAYLINTARGPVVDEGALVAALAAGAIAGAGLDVYEQEPVIHPGLLELENVVLLPHLGSASLATRERMGDLVFKNLAGYFEGTGVLNQVN